MTTFTDADAFSTGLGALFDLDVIAFRAAGHDDIEAMVRASARTRKRVKDYQLARQAGETFDLWVDDR